VAAAEGHFEAVRSGRLTGFVGREHELGLLMINQAPMLRESAALADRAHRRIAL
jgi:hypothetical protein